VGTVDPGRGVTEERRGDEMSYEVRDGWVVGELPGPNGSQVRVKHFPQGPYERRRRNNPRLCLHTTETSGYVETLRFPSEFQVGEDIIGQHRPLWARGAAVDEHDHDLLQIEIVESSRLDLWLPKPSSLEPLVALLAFLHRRGFVATALQRPERWPLVLDRLPAAVDTYYRRHEIWDDPFVYGHVEIPGDEHWDPGSLDHPTLFSMVRDVLAAKEEEGVSLTDNQLEGIEFANGMRRYLDTPENEPPEPGSLRQGFRFARRISTHIDGEPTPEEEFEPPRSSTEGMHLSPEEHHPGRAEEKAERRRLSE
jgi:hypothetical protein